MTVVAMRSPLLAAVLWCVAHGSNDGPVGTRYPGYDGRWYHGRSPEPRIKTGGTLSYDGESELWYTSSPGSSYRDYDNALSTSGSSMYYYNKNGGAKNMYNTLYERSGTLPSRGHYSRFENGYQDQLRGRYTGGGYGTYGTGYRKAGFYGSKSPSSGGYINPEAYRGSRIYDGTKTINFSPTKKTGVYVIPTPAKLYFDGVKN